MAFGALISTYILIKVWDIFTHPCPNITYESMDAITDQLCWQNKPKVLIVCVCVCVCVGGWVGGGGGGGGGH